MDLSVVDVSRGANESDYIISNISKSACLAVFTFYSSTVQRKYSTFYTTFPFYLYYSYNNLIIQ